MFAWPNECVPNKGEMFRHRSQYLAGVTRERKNLTGQKLAAAENVSLPTVRLIPRGLRSHFDPSVWEFNKDWKQAEVKRAVAHVGVDLSLAGVAAPRCSA